MNKLLGSEIGTLFLHSMARFGSDIFMFEELPLDFLQQSRTVALFNAGPGKNARACCPIALALSGANHKVVEHSGVPRPAKRGGRWERACFCEKGC